MQTLYRIKNDCNPFSAPSFHFFIVMIVWIMTLIIRPSLIDGTEQGFFPLLVGIVVPLFAYKFGEWNFKNKLKKVI